ncbi:hypothetical protein BDR26DRAFT_37670 [Obelidium mucronatum]|nr:hypothetical protein BDR26DRAFT_37670 [Obelidium mucronatum]
MCYLLTPIFAFVNNNEGSRKEWIKIEINQKNQFEKNHHRFMGANESKLPPRDSSHQRVQLERTQSHRPASLAGQGHGSSESQSRTPPQGSDFPAVKRSKSVDVGALRRGSLPVSISAPYGVDLTASAYGSSPSHDREHFQRLYRSNSAARSSVVPAGPAPLAPVGEFRVSLGVCEWVFSKQPPPQSRSGRRALPSASQWRHAFAASHRADDASADSASASASGDNATGAESPGGLLTLAPGSGACVLGAAPLTNAVDVRRLVEERFGNWKRAAVALAAVPHAFHRMPLHPSEADKDSAPQLENAWIAVLNALEDALVDLASLDYNKELSTAYEPDDDDDDDDADNLGSKLVGINTGINNHNDNDDSSSTNSSLDFDTLSKGLILTPQELKILEYSVSRKVQTLGAIVATLSTTAACLAVRISYQPRAANEVELAKGDLVSLWFNFDDVYGFG